MQYQQGGSRSRMAPFARGGGAYNRGQKQFYPPPPPVPAAVPPQNKYEVLMEAGRLAAEYLVAKGVLPPGCLQVRGGSVGAGGWGQLPPPPPLPAAPETPVYHNPRNDRGRSDREYSNPNTRSRRSSGGDYSSSNSSNYNRRGKRKFGADTRYSDWGRDRERGRGYSNSRSYDEDDEDGAPGFRRERRPSAVIDEVGSSVSGVAGEGPGSKVEVMGESELEDTGSKVSSSNTIQKNADATQEGKYENEAKNLQEDKVSDSEVVGMGNSNKASDVVQETEPKHSPVLSDGNVSGNRNEDSSTLNEKVEDGATLDHKAEDDSTSDAKLTLLESNSGDDARNLLNYCSFARVPKRPRSVLAHRNTGPSRRETSVAEQVELVSSEEMCPVANDSQAIGNSVADIQAESNHDLVSREHDNQSTACNQMAEPVTLHEKETQIEAEEMIEQSDKTQHYGEQENTVHSELSPTLAPCHNNLVWQGEKGIQIYNIDTPPQDEQLIDSSDKGKTAVPELALPNIGAEPVVAVEEQNLEKSSSFKIRDLNMVSSPDEIRNDSRLGQSSTAGCSMELQDKQQIDSGTTVDNNASNMNSYALLPNKEVIDIEDDSPTAAGTCNPSKVKTEMIYPSMENMMMNPPANTNILQGVQDGFNIEIPDYLGADMPSYQSMQTDLQAGMGLNDPGGITVMDSIYGSLGDISFMEVWDQPPQDFEKFF